MKEIKMYAIHRGYEIIGYAKDFDEAEKICSNYCKHIVDYSHISFSLKRKANVGDDELMLVFQYSSSYLEIFFITSKFEL